MKMKFALVFAGLAAAAACRAEVGDVTLGLGGTISIEGAPLVLKPLLFGNGWHYGAEPFGKDAPDAKTGRVAFEMLNDMSVRATGIVTAKPSGDGGVHVAFEMTAKEAFRGNENGLKALLSRDVFGGCVWKADGKSGVLPAPNKDEKGLRGSFKTFSLDLPKGKGKIVMAFDDRSLVMLQSTRHGTMMRLGRSGGTYKSGDRIAFGFTLRRADGAPIGVRYVGPYAIVAGDDWIPFVYRKDIVPDGILDFSHLGTLDAPAGKYGWLRGHGPDFEFEGRPGVVQRFYGANLCSGANYPETPEDAERLATRFARLGYNSVRVHHYDRPCSRLGADGKVELVPEAIAKLDRLLYACFRRGIYATTDLYVSRPVTWRELGVDRPGQATRVKTWFYATEAGWTNWCQFAREFMTHVNPHTGRRYADEPGLPFIVLVNEASFHGSWGEAMKIPGMKEKWRAWLVAARAKDPAAYPGADPENPPKSASWWQGGGAGVQAAAAFYAHVEGSFNRRARKFLREELGVKAMITGQNFGPSVSPIQAMREETCDYVDTHFYVDHPHFIRRRWTQPSRLVNENQAKSGRNVMDRMGYNRLWSKPFTISEYNFSGPGQYRAMGGALTGAMAAIQGWGALWRFAYSHGLGNIGPESQIPSTFDAASDALGQSSDRVAMMLFLRGDLAPAPEAVAIDLDDAALAPRIGRVYGAPAWDNSVAWNRRVGASVRSHAPADAMRVAPQAQTNAVPPFAVGNRSPFQLDRERGAFTFVTPRSCGGFAEEGDIRAGALYATVRAAPALVWATSLDGRDLSDSSRILLGHLTDVQGENTQYADATRKVLLRYGHGRSLARRGEASVRLALTRPESYEVWAVETDGTRVERVPSVSRDGALAFVAATRHAKGAILHYEIARVR